MNVLHAPVNVGSQASSLARAENEVRRQMAKSGKSWSADFEPGPIVSAADEVFPTDPAVRSTLRGKVKRTLGPLLYGIRNHRRFDLLHLYFGKSLLRLEGRLSVLGQMDLPLWKALGKTTFATFQGCDARIRSICGRESVSACAPGVCDVAACDELLDRRRLRAIRRFARYCDRIFCLNPDLLQFVPGAEFLPYANLDPGLLECSPRARNPQPVVIHAPTNRTIKGTRFIEKASEALRPSHPHILRMVEDCSRAEALRLYAKADILIDQLHVGWYGGLAVEGMVIGLPVVAYLNEHHLDQIPTAMRAEIPVVSATPATIQEVLADLLEHPGKRRDLGERGKTYVRRWHHPLKIARRMLELYEDPARSFWEGYNPEERRPCAA